MHSDSSGAADAGPPRVLATPATPEQQQQLNGAPIYFPSMTSPELDALRSKLAVERSVLEGALNFIKVVEAETNGTQGVNGAAEGNFAKDDLRRQVELELQTARSNIQSLEEQIREVETSFAQSRPTTPSPTRPRPRVTPVNSFEVTVEGVLAALQRLEQLDTASSKVKSMDSVVATVMTQPRVKYDLKLEESMTSIVAGLSEHAGGAVRSATYRLLRHLIVDQHDISLLHTHHLPFFLIRSIARGDKHEAEKEQALRLVRVLLALPEAPQAVPPSVIRAIVALAEAQEEKLRLASLETLGELLLRDIDLLVAGEGLRVVLQALSDGPHDFAPFLAAGFLYVMDRHETRQYLRPGLDVEVVLAGFAETPGKGSGHEERVKSSAKIITMFLKSWSGLLSLCLNDRQALTSLVNSLKTPSAMIREILLDIFFHIFNLKRPSWDKAANPPPTPPPPIPNSQRPNLIDQYLSIVLLLFIEAGLIETLVTVASELNGAAAKRVSLLLGELLRLSTRILPITRATSAQALPRLFSLTTSFDTSDGRLSASAALSTVNSFNQEKDRLRLQKSAESGRSRSDSLDDPLKRGQRQVESTKIRIGMQIEDAQFRNMLLESLVLGAKDHTKWSLPILTELLEGPLLNPRRLDEAMRASKFMRRLLGFFHPFNYRFSEIEKGVDDPGRYTQLGCLVITTLLANPDGVRYLGEDKLLPQIADCLAQLDPLSNTPASDVILSKHRMDKTIASGYFEMLGVLTKSPDGVKLLEQFKMYTFFYRISELRSRDDLIKAIICNIDYTLDGHDRVLLAKALTSSYKHIRVFATEHLAKLARETEVAAEWQIQLLLTQLYDPSPEVCGLAVRVLEEACQSLETLQLVVRLRPTLDHLGDTGALLLTRFLSTSIGARYLYEIDFIERELDDWYHERNFSYMVQIELLLSSAFSVGPSIGNARSFDGTPPSHFYGELVKTPEGCEILSDSGHFPRFADFIQQHGLEDSDTEVIGRLKSVLWAVGHVGSSEGGLPFLEDDFIIQSIVEIAEDSPVYSLRGTAYFVLGLISSTAEGAEILEELGWETVVTPLGGPTGICVPVNVSDFVDTMPWDPPPWATPTTLQLALPVDHLEREALAALANLSNHILATKASKSLTKLKARHPELFSSPSLLYRAIEMISNYHYRQPVRRYILELFDIPLDAASAAEIANAGEELKTKAQLGSPEEKMTWSLPNTTEAILVDGLDGGFTDDDDATVDLEEGEMIPLEVLKPLLTVKGFVIN